MTQSNDFDLTERHPVYVHMPRYETRVYHTQTQLGDVCYSGIWQHQVVHVAHDGSAYLCIVELDEEPTP